jgi:geranylgeranyl diphosphate synthase type 3
MQEYSTADYQVHQADDSVLEPYHYLAKVPGKNVRGQLVDAFNVWLAIDGDKVKAIKEVVGSLHTASLLIDDIEDNSKLRRGVPVAHAIYGIPSTINTANYVYFQAMEQCYKLGNTKAIEVFVAECLNLHRGQGQDIWKRDNFNPPTEAEYDAMVLDKTGGLFRLAVKLMQVFSKDEKDYIPLVNSLSLYFQIRDDYINLVNVEYHKNKSFCEDITEGKFSFPIIHAIHARPQDTRLINILKQRTEDVDVKKYAVQYLEQMGSLIYTKDRLDALYSEVLSHISILGGHPVLAALVQKLHSKLEPPPVVVAKVSIASSEPTNPTNLASSRSSSTAKLEQGRTTGTPAGGCALP